MASRCKRRVALLLVPFFGIGAQISTKYDVCTRYPEKFRCSINYPTLSYAAQQDVSGRFFRLGMSLTAIAIFVSIESIFQWFKTQGMSSLEKKCVFAMRCVGLLSGVALFALANFNMADYHDTHIASTVVFMVCAIIQFILLYYLFFKHWRRAKAGLQAWFVVMTVCFGNILLLLPGFGVLFVLASHNQCDSCHFWEAVAEEALVASQLLFMGSLYAGVGLPLSGKSDLAV